jgi:hypothetical protein
VRRDEIVEIIEIESLTVQEVLAAPLERAQTTDPIQSPEEPSRVIA